jgi:cytochrome c-type biogenesis protein CcsB
MANYGANRVKLPFRIKLNDFILERYPGSNSPSWFESDVVLIDTAKDVKERHRIYMNNTLKHQGYRFYQTSYDKDEKGTILTVNYDRLGTLITYAGYILLAIGIVISLLHCNTRFRAIGKKISRKKNLLGLAVILAALTAPLSLSQAQSTRSDSVLVPEHHAATFGKLLIQDNGGRIKPVNTMSTEVLHKVYRKSQYKDYTADQFFLSMLLFPQEWQEKKIIKVGHESIMDFIGAESKYARFSDFFTTTSQFGYKLSSLVEEANRKKPAFRSKFDTELIRVDERVNICFMVYSGMLLKIFPNSQDSTNRWYSPLSAPGSYPSADSVFTENIIEYYRMVAREAGTTGSWEQADEIVASIDKYQQKFGADLIPNPSKLNAEILYNRLDLFKKLSKYYLLAGFVLLIIQFIGIFKTNLRFPKIQWGISIVIFALFLAHTFSLGLRWYVSGHAPWSNGYEALTYIAWATVLSGFVFVRRSSIAVSSTAVLGALILQTAHLSLMDPQITNLVPVLKSYWLIIHVAVVTASYGFLALGAILALVNLLLLFFETKQNNNQLDEQITQLTGIIELTLTVGLYMLTIGTFLGGVWANESWGRYWAWDPKETWALITILVYAFILHMRLVPGLKGRVVFNIVSLAGFGSVIMTYFGVNYYLSGLHSYAQGDPLPIPPLIYYSVATVVVLSGLAWYNQHKLDKIRGN